MSVYTNVIIRFLGTENELKNLMSPNFDEYDHYLTKLGPQTYSFIHHECSVEELSGIFYKVAKHPKCTDLYESIVWRYR